MLWVATRLQNLLQYNVVKIVKKIVVKTLS